MYPGLRSVPTKCQQTGDRAEKETNMLTRSILPRGDANSIGVNDLTFVY
jgi:hypothetical protein